jgi:AcrR family transcriptional regulator
MARTQTDTTPKRGRPRSEKAHVAVLDAAAELLLDRGPDAVSMDAVAERAGVSKATIYRWWPTKEALALEALFHRWTPDDEPPRDTGALRGDLLALVRPWVRRVTARPYARVVAALATKAQADPAFAEQYVARFIGPRRDVARPIFERAIARGEVRDGVTVEVALDLLHGPLYHRLLHLHAPLDQRFARDVVDIVVAGISV